MRKKALVLGDDSRAFLSVVRSLGRGGVEVHVGWHGVEPHQPVQDRSWNREVGIAPHSRYIARAYHLPPYGQAGDDWKAALIERMAQEQFDLVIPCADPMVIPLQQHRSDLEKYGRLYLLDDPIFEIVNDKFKTSELARRMGVTVPREIVIDRYEQVEMIREAFELPVVLKPQASFRADNLSAKHAVHKAFSWGDFDRLIREMIGKSAVAVQENFIGRGVGVELLLKEGEPLMAFQHIRVHEPLHGGGSSYRRSARLHPDLLDASLKMLRSLRYTGVAMVEFKENPATGAWTLIEINGRFWGSLPLALACGMDFPLALFQMLAEGRTAFRRGYREGIYCRNLTLDLQWQIANRRADHGDPTLSTKPIGAVVAETAVNLLTFRERSDTLCLDDPGPGLAEVRQIVRGGADVLRRRVRHQLWSTPMARRLLWKRAKIALRNARRILFVCKGNICRSPFAHSLALQYKEKPREIRSAGYYPRDGRPSPETAIRSACAWGVDLREHRSVRLSEEMAQWADIIFVFDWHNYEYMWHAYPGQRSRLHLLGALCGEGPLIITDPWGEDAGTYDLVYRQIAAALGQPSTEAGVVAQQPT